MTETPSGDPRELSPPGTGDPTIDAALGRLTELSEIPVSEHHDRLVQAHAALDQVLGRDGADGA